MTQTITKIAYEADICRDCIKADCADERAFAEFDRRYIFIDMSKCENCNSVFNIKKTSIVPIRMATQHLVADNKISYPEWVTNMQNIGTTLGVEVVICDPTE